MPRDNLRTARTSKTSKPGQRWSRTCFGSCRSSIAPRCWRSPQAEAREREKNGGFRLLSAAELVKDFDKSPSIRHWHTIMRLRSLVVQVRVTLSL
jgi:hypothetical protein